MTQYQTLAEVVKKEQIAADIFRLTLRAPEIAGCARPGQFVMVRAMAGIDPLLRRPFSIHQVSSEGNIQILFKRLGKGTTLLARLEAGEQLDLVGPLGNGFDLNGPGKVCLVGGGMGIAPLYFLAREFLRQSIPPRLTVMLGARTREELVTVANDFKDLGVNDLSLATDDGTLGHHGLVLDLMGRQMAREDQWSVYTCGPHPMMKAVAEMARQNEWLCSVSLETMMACGISACLGCAIPRAGLNGNYLHVCKDGPVFDAGEVAWL
ncbi:MAG: dihydroorotate dehydrogenase electron transfer subunit [Desulfobulbaceae bacterium]|nr:dihydroorotate dehydrogenase electron transfer subunit [Desulfobulbaceae bacterium]HIJ79042.1 dihydroorotate dehydrogenase electron transfer subunit [Deltaproteobacteria bacterium]